MSVNIMDLLPDQKMVNIGKGEIPVRGIGIGELIPLINRYGMILQTVFDHDGPPNFQELMMIAPDVSMQLIAAGIGTEDLELARRIPLAAQLEILLAVWEVSVPDPKAFVKRLQELLATVQQQGNQKLPGDLSVKS